MPHFLNKLRPTPSLKEIRFPQAVLRWDSVTSWETFVNRVQAFASSNGLGVPSEAEIENQICAQVPQECSDGHGIVTRQPPGTYKPRNCKTCGGKR